MHIHNVYFWLKDDQDTAAFESGLKNLTRDPAVHTGFFGKPIPSERDVVDSSYSYGLVLLFGDTADHDAYQAGPVHLQFLDDHLAKWHKVAVYDIGTG